MWNSFHQLQRRRLQSRPDVGYFRATFQVLLRLDTGRKKLRNIQMISFAKKNKRLNSWRKVANSDRWRLSGPPGAPDGKHQPTLTRQQRDEKTVNSDTLALQQQPLPATAVLQRQRGEKEGGREEEEEKSLIYPFLARSLSLSSCSPSPKFDY